MGSLFRPGQQRCDREFWLRREAVRRALEYLPGLQRCLRHHAESAAEDLVCVQRIEWFVR